MKISRTIMSALVLMLVALLAVQAEDSPKKIAPAQPKKSSEAVKAGAPAQAAKKINWVAYDKGIADAKTTNKYVLVQVTTKSCGYCRKMEAEVFTDTSIIRALNTQFVPVRLWADSDRQLEIRGYKISEKEFVLSDYPVTGYPTFFFLAPSGRTVTSFIGYRDTPSLKQILANMKAYADTAKAE
jgi:thioredoxin-related protein